MLRRSSSSIWGHPDFRRLWVAQAISVVGTEITLIAFPIIAVTVLHTGPFGVAILSAAGLLPFLVLGLPAGVFVERLPRRWLMIACDLARAALLISVPLAALTGALTIAQLVVVSLGMGVCRLLFDVADTSFLPRIVSREELTDANSKLYLTLSAGQIVGPGIAGLLLLVVTAPVAIVVDVLSYLGSATLLTQIRQEGAPQKSGTRRPSWLTELAEGIRHVFGHPLLRPTTMAAGIYNAAEGGIRALFVAYMVTELELPPAVAAATIAAGAIGFPLGSVFAQPLTRRLGVGRASIWAAVAGTLGPVLIPFAPVSILAVPVLVIASFVTAFGPSIYGINYVSLRQAVTPDRLQARMNATSRFVVWGAMAVGAVGAGVLGELLGLRAAMAVMAVLGLLCIPVLYFSDFRRLVTVPEPIEDDQAPSFRSRPEDGDLSA
jgi:MFS family permease